MAVTTTDKASKLLKWNSYETAKAARELMNKYIEKTVRGMAKGDAWIYDAVFKMQGHEKLGLPEEREVEGPPAPTKRVVHDEKRACWCGECDEAIWTVARLYSDGSREGWNGRVCDYLQVHECAES